ATGGVRLAGVARRRGGRDAARLQPGHRLRRRRLERRHRSGGRDAGAGRRAGMGGGPDRRGRGRAGSVGVGVLISGTGTNLQALIDDPGVDVACVVSARADAFGLERAARAGIDTLVSTDEDETAAYLEGHDVGLVVLAGYMRILSPDFVGR